MQARHETDRVGFGRTACDVVVKGCVAIAVSVTKGAGERRLPALSRTVDQHGGRVTEGLKEAWLDEAREVGGGRHSANRKVVVRLIARFGSGRLKG